MKHLWTLMLMLIVPFVSQAKQVSCEKNPTYCQIKKNHPRLNDAFAIKLSQLIVSAAKRHNVPAQIYAAILMQESSYTPGATDKKCGYVLRTDVPFSEEACVESDVGISQINYDTIKRYNFDPQRLHDDLEYSIDAGAQVLSWFRKTYASRDYDWWTRYNCGVRAGTDRTTCQEYKARVSRYL